MKQQWDAEITITPGLCRRLIEEQFPGLKPFETEPFGEGFDNAAYLVNRKYLFRFPRRSIAVNCLETENRALPLLAPHLPLPVPVPIYIGKPVEAYPFPFAGYASLPGETACRLGLTGSERINLAETLAHLLKTLHAIPDEVITASGMEQDKICRLDLEKRVPRLYEYLERLPPGTKISRDDIERIIDDARRNDDRPSLVPVHGDFYFRHILIGADRKISGIIDWGDAHLGNPAIDISIAWGFLPPEGRAPFREAYGEIAPATWRLARFRALYMAALLLVYGQDVGDTFVTAEALVSLENVTDEE